MATLFHLRMIGLATGAGIYLFLIGLISSQRRLRGLPLLLLLLSASLFLIDAGGLLEIHARMEYAFPSDAMRVAYSSLILLGLLFVPALLVHAHLQFFEMTYPAIVPSWCKTLVLTPLYIAPATYLLGPFLAGRPPARFAPRFFPMDQIAQRLVRYFPWTPEAAFLFVALLLSIAIDLGILSAKDALPDADRRFFRCMAGISAGIMTLLLAAEFYRRFATPEIEGLSDALIAMSTLAGAIFAYFAVRYGLLETPAFQDKTGRHPA